MAAHSSRCVLSGERHMAKCQTLEINSLVMTTLDGENNTGEKVREEKKSDRCGEMEIEKDGRARKKREREDENTSSFLIFPLSQPASPSFQSCSIFFLCFFFQHLIVSFSLNLFSFFFFFFFTAPLTNLPVSHSAL